MNIESTNKGKTSGFLTLAVLRDVVIVLVIAIIAWKLLTSEFQIDLSKFSFSELLALILSLFSVSLSVAFYFKASDTSSRFYDNSYKFTKEMAEILGRIEAGFGEKLRHLDEGYSGIRDKFDRLPAYGESTNSEVKKEEAEVKKRQEEQRALLENLATRAKLAEGEKKEIFSKLAEKAEELEQARLELRHLRQSKEELSPVDRDLRHTVLSYIAEKIREATPPDIDPKSSQTSIGRTFRKIRNEIHSDAIRDLRRFDFIDEDEHLTREAIMRIRMEMKRI